MPDPLWLHGLQHTMPPYPSPTPGVYSNSCPLSLVMPSSHLILCSSLLLPPWSFPASWSFQMIQLFTSSGQSIEVSASVSVLPVNIQDWFPLGVYSSLCYKLEQNSLSASTVAWRLCVLTHPSGPWPGLCMQRPLTSLPISHPSDESIFQGRQEVPENSQAPPSGPQSVMHRRCYINTPTATPLGSANSVLAPRTVQGIKL